MTITSFKAKSGARIAGISLAAFREILKDLQETYLLSPLQISEAAGFSMAMVVRYALGLEAAGGQVVGLARDCISGAVTAATLRHLANSGANVMIGIESEPGEITPDTSAISKAYISQLEALNAIEVPIFLFHQVPKEDLETCVNNSHNIIMGLYDEREDNNAKELWPVIDILNESATPIHCIGSPLELDSDSGKSLKNPLYASSTLSLGVPFKGFESAKDLIGRHYVCDISIPVALREKHKIGGDGLFSEQPVVSVETVGFDKPGVSTGATESEDIGSEETPL